MSFVIKENQFRLCKDTPILLPIAVSVGMTPLHFGIALLMSLMVGSLTPPLSVNLFTSCRVLGMKVDEAIRRLDGIKCGFKPTSCPDQLAQALKQYKGE